MLRQLRTRAMPYRGLLIEATAATSSRTIAGAVSELRASRGSNSVWLRVPIAASSLIAEVAPLGFRYHHAEGDAAHLVLWLVPGRPSAVPDYATHQIGVGALVVRDRDAKDVLVVKEAAAPQRGWKLPGGLANAGEHFGETAEREVREETGVQARFERVLALRHQHGMSFGRSDVYVVCLLRARTTAIEHDKHEIEQCQWMDVHEYRAATTSAFNRRIVDLALDVLRGRSPGLHEETMASAVYPGRLFKMYSTSAAPTAVP